MSETEKRLTIEQGRTQALVEIVKVLMDRMNVTSEEKRMIRGSLPRDLGTTKVKIVRDPDEMSIVQERDVCLLDGYDSVVKKIIGE